MVTNMGCEGVAAHAIKQALVVERILETLAYLTCAMEMSYFSIGEEQE